MVFEQTAWKFDEVEDTPRVMAEEGMRYLLIEEAKMGDDGVYTLWVKDLQNDATFSLRYWLEVAGEDGSITLDDAAKGTLISLKHALTGIKKGIPNPVNIAGGVVRGNVVIRESKTGKKYPKVFKFMPVSEDWACMGSLDQYCEELSEEEGMEDGE